MKKLFLSLSLAIVTVGGVFAVLHAAPAHAAFTSNHIIDDATYNNTNTMNAGQIDAWLNSNFGSASCISTSHGFSAPDPTGYSPGGGFTYGANVSAGQVIYDAATAYGLNPQVLLTTLQKEESLVSGGSGCSVFQYTAAVGYGCPDSGTSYNYSGVDLYSINGTEVTAVNGTCVNGVAKAGFSEQLIHAAWFLEFSMQRSEGNTAWDVQKTNSPQPGDVWNNSDDPTSCYEGPMTQGSFKRCSSDPSPVFYDGFTTIDGVSTHMDNGATAALYWYTPHFSGNQHFYNIFAGWFGDPNTPCFATGNVTGALSGPQLLTYSSAGVDHLAYAQQNNTGTACTEIHLDAPGFQTWSAHVATAMRAVDPTLGMLLPSKSAVDMQSSLNYIVYSGGGGHVEIHRLSPNLNTFPGYYDVSTNLTGITPSVGTFVAGDFFGRGYDQLLLILYNGASGHVEIHMFDPTMRSAIGYYDVVTDLVGITPSTGTFVAGDFLGRGSDQLAFINYSGDGGHAEVHLFDPTLRTAIGYHDGSTDLTGVTSSTGAFIAGDFLGRGYSQLVYAVYQGSSGRVETHMFNPSLTQGIGYQDIITNISGITPGT